MEYTQDYGSVPPQVHYIDLRFGTKCNLKCVMCSPHDSSLWVKDWKKMHPQVQNETLKDSMQWEDKGSTNGSSYNWHKNNPVFWEQFYEQVPYMKQVYFAGGEPLIIEEHYEILEKIIASGKAGEIEIRYNSNGVEWRDDLFDLWKHFKLVRYHYSVDAVGDRNHYIRYPADWTRAQEAFRQLDSRNQ